MRVLLALSGGMDSTTLAAKAVAEHGAENVLGVVFDYGQRHRREIESAREVAAVIGIDLHEMTLPRLRSPSLTGNADVPEGHYAADTMVATVVQGRNLLFASSLVALADPGDEVWLGVHAGDHAIYADCRPEFVNPLADAVAAGYGVKVSAPFVALTKAEIAAISAYLHAPVHLSWSCYKGGSLHCGRCGTCVERAEAFAIAELPDPTAYEDSGFWRGVV